eukprot:m51a1_g2678 hypothetical protein (263) ;mRNA; r:733985-734847
MKGNPGLRAKAYAVVGALLQLAALPFFLTYWSHGITSLRGFLCSLGFVALTLPALNFAAVAASIELGIQTTGKRKDGTLPVWALVFWSPWMLLQYVSIVYTRRTMGARVPAVSEIAPGFWLGGFPAFEGFDESLACTFDAVVDVTCELPVPRAWRNYFNVPTWDGTAPSAGEVYAAAEWVRRQHEAGRTVLVHCCHGVGRSSTVMAAALVRCGVVDSTEKAVALMTSRRACVSLGDYHWLSLAEWGHLTSIRSATSASTPDV